jgi:hypothetical protein
MSIETTITGPKRAKAVCDEANRVPVAKRGMFAMVERRRIPIRACYTAPMPDMSALHPASLPASTARASSKK